MLSLSARSIPGCPKASMGAALCTFPVGPDKGQDHCLLLSALEAINRLNLELRVLAGEALSEQVHLKQKAGPRSHHQVRGLQDPSHLGALTCRNGHCGYPSVTTIATYCLETVCPGGL